MEKCGTTRTFFPVLQVSLTSHTYLMAVLIYCSGQEMEMDSLFFLLSDDDVQSELL
jgi:hypothetical protein